MKRMHTAKFTQQPQEKALSVSWMSPLCRCAVFHYDRVDAERRDQSRESLNRWENPVCFG